MPWFSPSISGVAFYGRWTSEKKPYCLPRHKNPGLEIVHIAKGQLRWEVEGREYRLGPGMLFYTLPWQEHGGVEEIQPSSEISFFCVKLAGTRTALKFHPAFRFSKEEEKRISSALVRSGDHAMAAGAETANLFRYLFNVAQGDGALRESRAREAIKLIILELAGGIKKTAAPSVRQTEERVRKFVQQLDPAEPWTLESMSAACGLGRSQFAELLKRQAGDAPITFLSRLRVRRAQELLGQPGKSITDVALEAGFNSSQYFATVFKAFTGMDARSFRSSRRAAPARPRR